MLVLIFHQTSWKESISRYRQLRALPKAVTVEIFSGLLASRCLPSLLVELPCLQPKRCCSTQEHSRSSPHSGQSADKQGSAGPVPSNPAQAAGNTLRMMYRVSPQLLPEGGAVAGEKLFFPDMEKDLCPQHQAFYRLMIDAPHNINCNSNH